jgi:hypothetical protein
MNIVWATAALYEPPEVLGKTLRGFSPFHALMLEAVQSPFMVGGDKSFDDLVIAVHICSHGWVDRFAIRSDMSAVAAWGKSVTADSIAAARRDFNLYLAESWKMPSFWQSGENAAMRANWIYHLAAFAMRRLHMTEAEAWDCPIARLVCYRACVGETEGDKSLMTDDDIKGIEVLKADEAAAKEKANGAS